MGENGISRERTRIQDLTGENGILRERVGFHGRLRDFTGENGMTGFWGEGAWGLIVYPIDCSHLGILCNTPPHGICPIGIASLASA